MSDILSTALLAAASFIVLISAAVLYRVIAGPTTHDRVMAVNIIGTSIVVILALIAAGLDQPSYLDIAIVYALLNFVLSLIVGRATYDPEGVEWR